MRCKLCGKDIGGLNTLHTIYEGKKWCECSFVKCLVSFTKNQTLKEVMEILISDFNNNCSGKDSNSRIRGLTNLLYQKMIKELMRE